MQNHVLARVLMLAAAVASLGARHAAPRKSPPRQLPALTPHDSALHALDRLAYGPRPGEVDAVAAGGVMNWIDGQLSPDQLDDRLVAERATAFRILRYDPRDLARLYAAASEERRGRQPQRPPHPPMHNLAPPRGQGRQEEPRGRRPAA